MAVCDRAGISASGIKGYIGGQKMKLKPSDYYNAQRFFFNKVTAMDVKKFCELNGFCLIIHDNGFLELRKDKT